MHLVSYTDTHHAVIDLVNHGMVKTMKYNFSTKQKNSSPVPQMKNFEKLSFCSGSNL